MENKLTEETIELVKEYLAKETEGLITEFTNLLDERDKLENEFFKAEDFHESFKYRIIWEDCRDRLKRYDDKKEIKSKEFEHDFFQSKSEAILFTSPLIINDISLHNLHDYDFCMKDLWQRSYSKIEFQKAISYIQKYIDLYKECIASRNNFIAENYYSTFIQKLKGLVLFYERSVKVIEPDDIKHVTETLEEKDTLQESRELLDEIDQVISEHYNLTNDLSFKGTKTWLECRDMIKDSVGLNSFAGKEDDYPFLVAPRHLDKYDFFKNLDIYSKEDLIEVKREMEQYVADLKANLALAKECISSNYFGNFMKDLEVLVRKYAE